MSPTAGRPQPVVALSPEVAGFVDAELGGFAVISARGASTGARVVEVVDGAGGRWFVKQVVAAQEWRREVESYRLWAPVLGDRAPRLRAADERLGVLVTSAVPGVRADTLRRGRGAVHRQAGALLRALHDGAPTRPSRQPLVVRARRRLESELSRMEDGLLAPEEVEHAWERLEPLGGLHLGELVRCHGDLTPRNLVVDEEGVVRVIDFGSSRWHVAAFDFVRLYYGPWWGRPRLAEQFFAGYGRRPTPDELVLIDALLAVHAVAMVRWGRLQGTPRVVDRARARLRTRLCDALLPPT